MCGFLRALVMGLGHKTHYKWSRRTPYAMLWQFKLFVYRVKI